MSGDAHIQGKDKNQLLTDLYDTADVGSRVHQQMKSAITVRCVEDLEKALKELEISMNSNAESSQSLARRIFWLNVVLTLATVVAACIAVYSYFYPVG